MKKIKLVFLCILLSANLSAQEIHSKPLSDTIAISDTVLIRDVDTLSHLKDEYFYCDAKQLSTRRIIVIPVRNLTNKTVNLHIRGDGAGGQIRYIYADFNLGPDKIGNIVVIIEPPSRIRYTPFQVMITDIQNSLSTKIIYLMIKNYP
ncbi:MAG: hypothetical protein RL757_2740 [Bacteroidota bacterium]|jgi:hypothetical protein